MIAILKFNLTDPDDAERFRRVNKADDLAGVLWNICHDRNVDICEDCKAKVYTMMEDDNINLDEIYT